MAFRPVSAFDTDNLKAVRQCFDRNTRQPIRVDQLKPYRDLLAQYHLHPEAKFDNGDFLDKGITERRHIIVNSIGHIGKEASRLEEQFFLGIEAEAQVVYGMARDDFQRACDDVIHEARRYSQRDMALVTGYSLREVSRVMNGKFAATPQSPDFKQQSTPLRGKSRRPPKSFREPDRPSRKTKSAFGNSPLKPGLSPQTSTTPFQANALQALKCSPNSSKY